MDRGRVGGFLCGCSAGVFAAAGAFLAAEPPPRGWSPSALDSHVAAGALADRHRADAAEAEALTLRVRLDAVRRSATPAAAEPGVELIPPQAVPTRPAAEGGGG